MLFLSIYMLVFFIMLYIKYRERIHEKSKSTSWRPLVSVIIPAYNEGKYIENCIRTVLDSNYDKTKLEIIVVDDGSTDDTYEVSKSIKDSRVKVLKKSNSGKAASLNFGIKRANGEVIATMDADSFIEKDTIENMLPLFDADDVAAVTAAVRVKPSNKWIQEAQRVEYLAILFARRLLSFIDAVPVTPGPFSMFRKWTFERVGGFDEKNIVEDHEIALRIQSNNYKIRSSIDANVYTETPLTIKDLLIQRVRWQRGGLHNTIAYRYLIHPRYGDFGLFVVPLVLLSFVMLFMLLAFTYDSFINPPAFAFRLGLDSALLSISPVYVLGLVIMGISFVWSFAAVKAFKNEPVNTFAIFLFIVFYGYLSVAYNLLTIFKELRQERFSW